MAKIAIIGASGFVGSAVLKEALSRGHEVTAIVRHPEKLGQQDSKLTVVKGDVQNEENIASLLGEADEVISAFNPGWQNPDIYNDTLTGYKAIIEGVKKAGKQRLLIVGGAGTLFVAPGKTVLDTGVIPEAILPGVKSLAKVYYDYLKPETDLDWVFFSPAGDLHPGEKTGTYRLGKDDLIVDATGKSHISVGDYAAALLDEAEKPQHHKERFTIGY
ncbi:hypothetical protein SAMN05216436_10437 [bacterium A37T11]|nr:hypothetical protein SAMN05216436_10437 [bacterium A37T11]